MGVHVCFSRLQAALWLHGVRGRKAQYAGPREGRDAAARAAASALGFVISNRASSGAPFTFHIALEGVPPAASAPAFDGHEYGTNATDAPLGRVVATRDAWGHWAVDLPVPPLTLQFWLEATA
jgi:hypothetical protein